jgi:hypothetical protein
VSKLGITVASGMLKGVFSHGVLSAFEEHGLRADGYGAASSSTLSCGLAAAGQARQVGVGYWHEAASTAAVDGMSKVVLDSIAKYGPMFKDRLFASGAPRFLVATSRVITETAEARTQGPEAAALGMSLLKDVVTRNRTWVDENLVAEVYDTQPDGARRALTADNFDEVAYASTRMLHAWEVPATVAGEPHVDASYTCSCPARELAESGMETVVAISTEHKSFYRDLYRTETIVDGAQLCGAKVLVIKPPVNLSTLGVDFANASASGLSVCYELGVEVGTKFLAEFGELVLEGSA